MRLAQNISVYSLCRYHSKAIGESKLFMDVGSENVFDEEPSQEPSQEPFDSSTP